MSTKELVRRTEEAYNAVTEWIKQLEGDDVDLIQNVIELDNLYYLQELLDYPKGLRDEEEVQPCSDSTTEVDENAL